MKKVPDILKSKKFKAMIIGIIIVVLVKLVPGLEAFQEELDRIVAIIISFIFAQGIADINKEAKK